jgi:hypothetical protein
LFKSGKAYNDKARQLLFNLEDPKNPNARRALLAKEETPERFLSLDVRLFASEELKT